MGAASMALLSSLADTTRRQKQSRVLGHPGMKPKTTARRDMLDKNTIILRYAFPSKEMDAEKQDDLIHDLHMTFSMHYGFYRVDRAFYNDGGYPSRVVKLYFETCEGAESLWKKLEQGKALMPKLLTRPTQADLTYVKGCGEVYQADDRKKIARRDGGFTWKLKNLVM